MKKPLSEKEKLLTILTEIYDQLEKLELVLETSFSDLRNGLINDELNKMTVTEQKLTLLENELLNINSHPLEKTNNSIPNNVPGALKFEMGF